MKFLFLLFLTVSLSLASRHKLSTITNDYLPKEKAELFLIYNSDQTIGEFGIAHADEEYIYPIEELSAGIVLVEMEGYQIITISSVKADPIGGGHITLRYLTNGISKKYKEIKFFLIPHFGKHSLFDQKKSIRVHTIFGKIRKVLGQPVGIKTIVLNPKKRTELPLNQFVGI